MSQVHQKGTATPEMNMTPLIDVTFQLIIFFMLVSNIVSEENPEMIVPDLINPKTRELGEVERITLNVEPMPFDLKDRSNRNPLDHPGEATQVKISITGYGTGETEAIRAALVEARQANPETSVVLRADAALYYREVQPVMDAIVSADIKQVDVVAKMPPKE